MAVIIHGHRLVPQRVTTRQAYVLAMATFCVGTALAAVAPVFWVLLAAASSGVRNRHHVPLLMRRS